MAKKKKDHGNLSKTKIQNIVAKHSRNMAGAGKHVDKSGEKAPRVRQKREWKKGIQYENTLIQNANSELVYESAESFDQALLDIEQEFGISLEEKYDSENDATDGFNGQQKRDMNKLIQQYQGQAGDVHDQLGNDLEMLEYQPDEVGPMISYITSQLVSNN